MSGTASAACATQRSCRTGRPRSRQTAHAQGERVALALSEELERLMAAHPDRSRATRFDRVLGVIVERERARFGAWYEMFPRSAGTDPSRSATFDEAAARLPYIAAMGFDVLYLPPIHPIGRSFRKGPNNSLTPGPDDPGSPWAIGSDEGGHMAVEPGLGTIDDFDRFVERGARGRASRSRSTSPTRPRRITPTCASIPNGSATGRTARSSTPRTRRRSTRTSIRSTSNRRHWQALWHELKRVIEFWIEHGVKIFRVDNPHTKPYRVLGMGDRARSGASTRTRSSCRRRSRGRR